MTENPIQGVDRRTLLLQDVWDLMSDNGIMRPEVTTLEMTNEQLEDYIKCHGHTPTADE